MRPCHCDNCDKPGSYQEGQCYKCWLYHNSPKYRAKWDASPGILAKIASLTGAVRDHIKAGLPLVDEPSFAARMATCETCPHLQGTHTCGVCGCNLNLKARWAEQKCPVCKKCGRHRDEHGTAQYECEFESKWEETPGLRPQSEQGKGAGCGCR